MVLVMGDNAETINSSPQNSPSINISHEQAHAKIIKEVDIGHMAGPFTKPPFEPFQRITANTSRALKKS